MQRKRRWEPAEVRGLRTALGLTQQAFAAELGVRQQTVSDWETGTYAPRGASVTVLNFVAERVGTGYRASPDPGQADAD